MSVIAGGVLIKKQWVDNPENICKLGAGEIVGRSIVNMPKLGSGGGGTDNRLGEEVGRVGGYIFHKLKNIQFAFFRINLLYLGHGTLNNRPSSRAERK